MTAPTNILPPRVLLWAPLIFIGHFMEEAPGFVNWFNAHVRRGITAEFF